MYSVCLSVLVTDCVSVKYHSFLHVTDNIRYNIHVHSHVWCIVCGVMCVMRAQGHSPSLSLALPLPPSHSVVSRVLLPVVIVVLGECIII